MTTRTTLRLLLPVVLTVWLSGCTLQMPSDDQDLAELRAAMSKRFDHDNVAVKLANGKILQIRFVNSVYSDLTAGDRRLKAMQIATFASDRFVNREAVSMIDVAFEVRTIVFAVFSFSNSIDSFLFTEATLESARRDDL